jgi:hypothetical protein
MPTECGVEVFFENFGMPKGQLINIYFVDIHHCHIYISRNNWLNMLTNQDIYMNSVHYDSNGYGHDLDLPIISH